MRQGGLGDAADAGGVEGGSSCYGAPRTGRIYLDEQLHGTHDSWRSTLKADQTSEDKTPLARPQGLTEVADAAEQKATPLAKMGRA